MALPRLVWQRMTGSAVEVYPLATSARPKAEKSLNPD